MLYVYIYIYIYIYINMYIYIYIRFWASMPSKESTLSLLRQYL